MGKKAKTPQAPDYTALANQQAQQGQEAWNAALQAGRPNQSNPFGSLTWNQDPTTGQWSQNVALNQPQQDIFNQQQANQQQIANAAGGMLGGLDTSQIDFSGAPAAGQVGQFNQQATDLYRQLGQPDLDRAQAARRAALAARGISDVTSQAGTNLEAQLADQTNRFGMQAAQAGIAQGNTMFGQQNALRQQEIGNILAQRQANLGQLSGLMGLGQNMGTPQFNTVQTPNPYNTANLTGAAESQYKAQVDAANAKAASSPWGTIGSLAGMAAGSFLGPMGSAAGSALGKGLFGGSGGGVQNSYPNTYAASMGQLYGPPQS
jgi:hypothetical protein